MAARIFNTGAGLWLFVSALAWEHSAAQFHNAWISGVLVVSFALLGLGGRRKLRYFNFAIGLWLVASVLVLPTLNSATFVNHLATGIAIAIAALTPTRAPQVPPDSNAVPPLGWRHRKLRPL